MDVINERVFKLLGNKHGEQKRLADYLNRPDRPFSNKTITAWKRRGSKIPAEFIPDIAEFFNVPITSLLGPPSEEEIKMQKDVESMLGGEIKNVYEFEMDAHRKASGADFEAAKKIPDIELSEIEYALFGETKHLDEEQQQELLRLAKFFRKQKEQKQK